MKITLLFLTYNRVSYVKRSVIHNLKNAGAPFDELIWVDNGSTDGVINFMKSLEPDVMILNKENLGVAKGYNRGFALATGDYIIIPGTDTLLSKNWLLRFRECVDENLGFACMTNGDHIEYVADNTGPKIISKKAIRHIGYLREDYGLYGWDDIEWGRRARLSGFTGHKFPFPFKHLGCEGISAWNKKTKESEYHKMKNKEATDPRKAEISKAIEILKHPYYNPYA